MVVVVMDLICKIPATAFNKSFDNAKIQFITNHNASSTIGMEINQMVILSSLLYYKWLINLNCSLVD